MVMASRCIGSPSRASSTCFSWRRRHPSLPRSSSSPRSPRSSARRSSLPCSRWGTTSADGTTRTRRTWRLCTVNSRPWTFRTTSCGSTSSTPTGSDTSRGTTRCSRGRRRCKRTYRRRAARWSPSSTRTSNEIQTTPSTPKRRGSATTSRRRRARPRTSTAGAGPGRRATSTSRRRRSARGGPTGSPSTSTSARRKICTRGTT
mmetsp:Transcript_18956/g.75590  ORF Transcript_18956/g.75590 Transcript_18956/m.75590 type:complete len:203 (+) Transcript_18956:821-1429(+)